MRHFSDKIVYGYNPLPDVTDEEIVKRAGVRIRTVENVHPFNFNWVLQGAEPGERESVDMIPGISPYVPLRGEAEKNMFIRKWGPKGGVIIDDPADKEEVKKAALQGLMKAEKFYRDRGQIRADDYQNRHALADTMMERRKGELWAWYYNEACADIIGEHADSLRYDGGEES